MNLWRNWSRIKPIENTLKFECVLRCVSTELECFTRIHFVLTQTVVDKDVFIKILNEGKPDSSIANCDVQICGWKSILPIIVDHLFSSISAAQENITSAVLKVDYSVKFVQNNSASTNGW